MIPAGDLRDVKASAKRAEIIIITKCKPDLSEIEKTSIIKELRLMPDQKIFFTEIIYAQPYHLYTGRPANLPADADLLLITGIANPKPIKEFLATNVHSYDMLRYPDHHIFTISDLKEIKKHFEKLSSRNKIILTTEKDGVRLKKFQHELSDYPVFILPIKHRFLFGEADQFDRLIFNFIESFSKS